MRRTLTPAEAALWRCVARSARPLPGKANSVATTARPGPRRPIVAEAAPQPASPLRATNPAPPADRGGEKRVQRGWLDIDARLDLHGMTQDRARAALLAFVAAQRAAGARVVLAITGKSGVLRVRLADWLAGPDFRVHLAGFAEAHRRHGGEGAWYVFLKRR